MAFEAENLKAAAAAAGPDRGGSREKLGRTRHDQSVGAT